MLPSKSIEEASEARQGQRHERARADHVPLRLAELGAFERW